MNTTKYRAYNLYALTHSGLKNTEQTFIACILHAVAWLKQHCQECPAIAESNKIPQLSLEKFYENPFDFTEKDKLNFQIKYEPYTVKAEYDEANGNWALRLTEPDGFYQKVAKESKAGRIFITDIAFNMQNDSVECAFKTTVVDKLDNISTPAKQFAISCVGNIARDKHIGLQDFNYYITGKPFKCKESGDVDALIKYINNDERKMPVVVMFESIENKLDTKQASMKQLESFLSQQKKSRIPSFVPVVDSLQIESHKSYQSPDVFADKAFGIAQVFVISEKQTENAEKKLGADIREGSILLWGPKEKLYVKHMQYHRSSLPEHDCLDENLDNSPIFFKAKNALSQAQITFGTVSFVKDDADDLICRDDDKEKNKADELAYNVAKAITEAYPKEIISKLKETIISEDEAQTIGAKQKETEDLQKKYAALYDSSTRRTQILNEENVRLKKNDKDQAKRIETLEKRCESIEQKEEMYRRLLDSYKAKDLRPQKESKVAEWICKTYPNIVISANNFDIKEGQVDMKSLCDAIEYLATEYHDFIFSKITKEFSDELAKEKYGKVFDITHLDDTKYDQIVYDLNHNGKLCNCGPTLHLRHNNADKIFRIYFFLDKMKQLIVVTKICKHDYQTGKSK